MAAIHTFYEVVEEKGKAKAGSRLHRTRKVCPRCGAGVFLAEHKDRYSCGKCGYTEFRKK
ncbi:MAG: 30S ribosomal protein S27ae [Methanophagales archaeon]|nr:30S ribosomal protein S27ae [Methanophagales archaeon]MCW3140937.1 30S ribosomal protein S27ae [Methanophagales archaeon]